MESNSHSIASEDLEFQEQLIELEQAIDEVRIEPGLVLKHKYLKQNNPDEYEAIEAKEQQDYMYSKGGLMADKLNLARLGEEDSTPIYNHNPTISESSINSFFLNEFWEDYNKSHYYEDLIDIQTSSHMGSKLRNRVTMLTNRNALSKRTSKATSKNKVNFEDYVNGNTDESFNNSRVEKARGMKGHRNNIPVTTSIMTTSEKQRIELTKQFQRDLEIQIEKQKGSIHKTIMQDYNK